MESNSDIIIRKLVREVMENKYAYHVTSNEKLNDELENGLEPEHPEGYEGIDTPKGVYLFKTLKDVYYAMYHWLGKRISSEENETGDKYNEVVLEINISGLEDKLVDSAEHEWICLSQIEPNRIMGVLNLV